MYKGKTSDCCGDTLDRLFLPVGCRGKGEEVVVIVYVLNVLYEFIPLICRGLMHLISHLQRQDMGFF